MRSLTANEMTCVAGGWGNNDDWQNQNPGGLQGLTRGFGDDPASGSTSGGNGSGNGGISPGQAQGLIGVVTIAGAITDPASALEAGHTADAANTAQQYNQSAGKAICEGPDQGTWDTHANNGGGGCVYH